MPGFLGSGDLYMDRYDASGNAQGFYVVGNAFKFAIKEESEIKERESRMKDTYGQALDTVSIKKPAKISITVNDLKKENLAMCLLGDLSDLAVTGSSVTDEAMTAKHDLYVPLAQRNITSGTVVLTDSTGTTTYVLGTDYEVHLKLGMIKALSTGAITDAQSLLVDYDYGSLAGGKIAGSARPTIKAALKLDGLNQANQKECMVNVLEAVLTPTGEVDFLSENWNEVGFEGSLNTPTGQTSPYIVEYLE